MAGYNSTPKKSVAKEPEVKVEQPVPVAATSKDNVMTEASVKLVSAQRRRKELYKEYRKQETVSMEVSPMYRPYFGNVMTVTINGISIYFKVDGKSQKIPQVFADEILRRRRAIDAHLIRQKKMSDVKTNSEASPGELRLF